MRAKTGGDYFCAGGGTYNWYDAMVATQIKNLKRERKRWKRKRSND